MQLYVLLMMEESHNAYIIIRSIFNYIKLSKFFYRKRYDPSQYIQTNGAVVYFEEYVQVISTMKKWFSLTQRFSFEIN